MAAKEKKMPTLDGYLKSDRINQKLYDDIKKIPTEDKQDRVLETLHRRLASREKLAH